MSTTRLATVEDLLATPDDGWQYEIVNGEIIRMPPAGAVHGKLETRFIVRLSVALEGTLGEEGEIAQVYPGDTGFYFSHDPLTIRAPDVAVVLSERLPPDEEQNGYLDLIPDLVVEIVSPSQRAADVAERVAFYLDHGVPMVWVAYPKTKRGVVHRPGREPRQLGLADAFDGEDILPGVSIPLARLFR